MSMKKMLCRAVTKPSLVDVAHPCGNPGTYDGYCAWHHPYSQRVALERRIASLRSQLGAAETQLTELLCTELTKSGNPTVAEIGKDGLSVVRMFKTAQSKVNQ